MRNISKNLFLALTLVCVIALLVFCIQLIVINSGVEPRQPNSTISGVSPGQGDNTPGSGENPGNNGENGNTGDNGNEQPTIRPQPQGSRNELMIDTSTTLIIYAREEIFNFIQNDLDWQFEYTGSGNAGLEISFVFISLQGAAADAEAFLNNQTGGTGAEYKGDLVIQGSSVRGYHVTANDGGVSYEAWVHQLRGSDLALAFLINYTNSDQRDALYEVLSSMDIEQG